MTKRLFDIVAAGFGLIVTAPIVLASIVGIRLSSPGPVFYCPQRAGRNGCPFTVIKLRTMHVARSGSSSRITASGDQRVFRFGALLRKLKVDELPQLLNVLRGEMSLIGPRPEDLSIVQDEYGDLGWKTLQVRPGLAGVSSIFNYTHGELMLLDGDAERIYFERLLPLKLALEAIYIERESLVYDVRLAVRTLFVLAGIAAGREEFAHPPEYADAVALLTAASHSSTNDAAGNTNDNTLPATIPFVRPPQLPPAPPKRRAA